MTLYNKVGDALKQVQSLPVKINGEIKDISTLYSKKDGALVVVFSSGALIEFMDYPYAIPVASGWQYSTDGKTWTTVSADGEIPGKVGDWDLSNLVLTCVGDPNDIDEEAYVEISGITGSTPQCTTVELQYLGGDDSSIFTKSATVSGNNPNNSTINATVTPIIFTRVEDGTAILHLKDADGNIIASKPETVEPFTGYVKVKGELSLSEYYNETGVGDTIAQVGLRKDGTALSTARYYTSSFVNGEYGFVCGGYIGSASSVVDTYDKSGTRATGTALSTARWGSMSFVNGDYGFICGGRTASSTASTVVNLYNKSGTRSTGTSMSYDRAYGTGFTHGEYGYVAGGVRSSSTYRNYVERYSATGSRSTGTALGGARAYLTSFVLGDYAYVCGGQSSSSTYQNTVYKYNTSGSMTTGTNLSITRSMLTSFVNGNKGYVCGGYTGSSKANVDVYDTSGTMTTGTALSVARYEMTSFVLNGYGFVCGGNGSSNVVDVYSESGTRSTGNALKTGRSRASAFALGEYGFVCGGHDVTSNSMSSVVDMYYHEYETLYFANIPITEGATYTLNGESGTADVSEVLTFDSPVTGTIKYKKGDLTPGVQITVVDASGNVVEGAEINLIEVGDWDMSGFSASMNASGVVTISNVIGSHPEIQKIRFTMTSSTKSETQTSDLTVSGFGGHSFNESTKKNTWYLNTYNSQFTSFYTEDYTIFVELIDAYGNVIVSGSYSVSAS